MTGKKDFEKMPGELSPKVRTALGLAEISGVSTALITGKGEPLYEKGYVHVIEYLRLLRKCRIPFIEVQTSGYGLDDNILSLFAKMGVTTVAISCVSDSLDRNRKIFGPEYEDPFEIAERVHQHGMMVRLCCTMLGTYMDSWESAAHLIQSCKIAGIEQSAFAPATAPEKASLADPIAVWIKENGIHRKCVDNIYKKVRTYGTKLMTLMQGGEVYDIDGVSVCIRYCLTADPETNSLRQVIVFPNGETRYSWTSKAAKLIRGD